MISIKLPFKMWTVAMSILESANSYSLTVLGLAKYWRVNDRKDVTQMITYSSSLGWVSQELVLPQSESCMSISLVETSVMLLQYCSALLAVIKCVTR